MARELDLTELTVVREATYRHPAGSGDGTWTCPVCRTHQVLADAALVRVRDDGDGRRDEFALVMCSGCRRQMRSSGHRSAPLGPHEVVQRSKGRRRSGARTR